jgi:hypothetical protein
VLVTCATRPEFPFDINFNPVLLVHFKLRTTERQTTHCEMNASSWAAVRRTMHPASVSFTTTLGVRGLSPRTAPVVSKNARTTLQPRLYSWHPWMSRMPQLRTSRLYRTARCVRYNSSKPSPHPTAQLGSPPSLGERLKQLSREYGWSALGVYFLLSALDFPFCFLAVRALGTERIAHWEHAALEWIKGIIPFSFSTPEEQAPQEILDRAGAADWEMVNDSSATTVHAQVSSEMDTASRKGDACM